MRTQYSICWRWNVANEQAEEKRYVEENITILSMIISSSHSDVYYIFFKFYTIAELFLFYFLFYAVLFDDLRYEFIEPKYFNNPCEFRLALLLATQNERALKNLALFVYKAFNRRKTMLLCRTWKRYDIYKNEMN